MPLKEYRRLKPPSACTASSRHVYTYVYTHTYIYTYIYISLSLHIYIFTYIRVCVCVSVCVCVTHIQCTQIYLTCVYTCPYGTYVIHTYVCACIDIYNVLFVMCLFRHTNLYPVSVNGCAGLILGPKATWQKPQAAEAGHRL